jgi:putative glutamine amidotransferase
MTRRPNIGIVMQTQTAIPGERPTAWMMGKRYLEVLGMLDAVPVLIPLLDQYPNVLQGLFEQLDGVLLAGGSDIEPARYGEIRCAECGPSDPDRDAVEILLVKYALSEKLPILGLCRGVQLLNVACGGTLYQDIPSQVPGAIKHDFTAAQQYSDRASLEHDVRIKPNSLLAQVLGESVVLVNSIHHQAVKELGQNLVATAYSNDGVVEAIEGTVGGFLLGVQWHPEELVETDPRMKRLFTAFRDAVKERGGM